MSPADRSLPERPVPERPSRPDPPMRVARGSLLPVALVLVPLVILVMGIVAFTGQAGLMMMAAVACIPAFMMLHYMLWGRWLLKSLRQNPPPEDD